ncbi:UvrD-helicase domain-containing protein [Aldersonia sp. NBC_00410]|uniref:UvrD-helicase domain-containing protein n=1 Tax=Aldersonia sp. NBC_00410 TaxID=2975954 RepID=UPI00224DC886|nr:UvrD-helicase domain-containing protein [Aldersonia sp. NBC_00410]MCX5045265.1 UvrD-helicase domain-containing protein [Aldersonia sp. NBC_00410]
MTFTPRGSEQKQIIESEAKLAVVLGGAGTGKTTCALAAAKAHLDRVTRPDRDRVLFLSFSRASVARISDRSNGILGTHTDHIDVSTFHALAYSIVRRFGRLVGRANAVLVSPPRERFGTDPESIGYSQLMPLALKIIRSAPAVADHLRSRWGLVIVDEFQDTGDMQHELLNEIAFGARVLLLGDQNQCIYTWRTEDGVRLERISEAVEAAGAENTIQLPEVSHRDPSGIIPSVARAVLQRDFASPAIVTAVDDHRLEVRSGIRLEHEVEVVTRVVKDLQDEQYGVAVFTHHNDMLAALSDGLEADGIQHEIAGLSDALACALDTQVAMLQVTVGTGAWSSVLDALAVFVTSAQRGRAIPQLATEILDATGTSNLHSRLSEIRTRLEIASNCEEALHVASHAHESIGLTSKSAAWEQAAKIIRPMRARAVRQLGAAASERLIARNIASAAREATYSALTDISVNPKDVQLMNLYQTKGREADATVVVLREGDIMGFEREPFPSTSRLLYVVFSRARHRITVLLVGHTLHPAVAPLAHLTTIALVSDGSSDP